MSSSVVQLLIIHPVVIETYPYHHLSFGVINGKANVTSLEVLRGY